MAKKMRILWMKWRNRFWLVLCCRFAHVTQISVWTYKPYKTGDMKKESNNPHPPTPPTHPHTSLPSSYQFCLKHLVLETWLKDRVNMRVRWWNIKWSASVDKDDWELEWIISDWQQGWSGSDALVASSLAHLWSILDSVPPPPLLQSQKLRSCVSASLALADDGTQLRYDGSPHPIRKWIILSWILTTFSFFSWPMSCSKAWPCVHLNWTTPGTHLSSANSCHLNWSLVNHFHFTHTSCVMWHQMEIT